MSFSIWRIVIFLIVQAVASVTDPELDDWGFLVYLNM